MPACPRRQVPPHNERFLIWVESLGQDDFFKRVVAQARQEIAEEEAGGLTRPPRAVSVPSSTPRAPRVHSHGASFTARSHPEDRSEEGTS